MRICLKAGQEGVTPSPPGLSSLQAGTLGRESRSVGHCCVFVQKWRRVQVPSRIPGPCPWPAGATAAGKVGDPARLTWAPRSGQRAFQLRVGEQRPPRAGARPPALTEVCRFAEAPAAQGARSC